MLHTAVEGARPLLVELPIRVQTYDIDFAGHVNNCVYVRWLEDLRMAMLRKYYPIERLIAEKTAPILVQTNIHYRKSIDLADEPIGRMWCTKIGRATLHIAAEICVGETCCADATQRGILLNIGTTRPARIPKDLIDAFERTNQETGG